MFKQSQRSLRETYIKCMHEYDHADAAIVCYGVDAKEDSSQLMLAEVQYVNCMYVETHYL